MRFVCADRNAVESAVVLVLIVIFAFANGALDRVVLFHKKTSAKNKVTQKKSTKLFFTEANKKLEENYSCSITTYCEAASSFLTVSVTERTLTLSG